MKCFSPLDSIESTSLRFFLAQKQHKATRQRLQDLYVRLLKPPVGIAGIGRSGDSPESKGSRARRQAISLQECLGELSYAFLILFSRVLWLLKALLKASFRL